MINDLKLGFRILKYGHGVKSTVICGIFLMLLGILMGFVNVHEAAGGFPSGYFLMLGTTFVFQLLYSVNMSNLVQSSPVKKKLQTSVPTVLGLFTTLCCYLAVLLEECIMAAIHPEAIADACSQILFISAAMGSIMLFSAVVYKYFVVSSVAFVVVFFAVFYKMGPGRGGWRAVWNGTGVWEAYAFAAAVGLIVILVCGVLQYLLSLAVYKAPISNRAMLASLRRQL